MTETTKQFRFSKRGIENLPPQSRDAGAREAEYSDTECPGLKVLVSRGGRKFWYLRYTFRQQRRAIKLGEFPATTLIAARQRANELKGQIDRGVDPQTEKQKIAAIPTFRAFAEGQYLPYAEQTKRSHADDRSRLEHHLYDAFGRLTLDAITPQKVQLFLAERRQSGLAPATVNRLRSLLQRMFALAIQWDILEKNPVQGLPKLQENNARQRYLSPEEVLAFTNALAAEKNRQAADFLTLLLLTGARVGELLNTRHGDIADTAWLIPISKSGKSRIVFLGETAKALFARQPRVAGNDYLFPGSPRQGNPRMVAPVKAFERVKAQAELRDLRLHDLRHSFASLAIQAGATLYDIQNVLGHSTPQMTQRYSHLADTRRQQVSDQVEQAVASALLGPTSS